MREQNLSAFAHNAAIVNRQEPSLFEDWHFVGTTAYPCRLLKWDPSKDGGHFSGEHMGYYDNYGIRYVRDVTQVNRDEISINDHFEGTGEHCLLWMWLFAPSVKVELSKGTPYSVEMNTGDQGFLFAWEDGKLSSQLLDSHHYPEYGKSVPTRCLRLSTTSELPYSINFTVRAL